MHLMFHPKYGRVLLIPQILLIIYLLQLLDYYPATLRYRDSETESSTTRNPPEVTKKTESEQKSPVRRRETLTTYRLRKNRRVLHVAFSLAHIAGPRCMLKETEFWNMLQRLALVLMPFIRVAALTHSVRISSGIRPYDFNGLLERHIWTHSLSIFQAHFKNMNRAW